MNRKALYFGILILMATLIFWPTAEDSGRTRYAIPPKAQVAPLGERGEGPSFSKASDVQLQSLLTSVAPKFALSRFHDLVSGCSITYNIFTPDTLPGRKYPLVLFMADASTPGLAPTYPLTQGLGGLIWADPSWQKKHPCFVVVPQFSGRAVNDAWQHTSEVDAIMRLLDVITNTRCVDTDRIYVTGQSMGGMIALYLNSTYPDVFAASIYVESAWAPKSFELIASQPCIYFLAGNNPKTLTGAGNLERACARQGIEYRYLSLNAKRPLVRQDEELQSVLNLDSDVNIVHFTPGSVLPAIGGNEHMHSFDCAYRLHPIMPWLFSHTRKTLQNSSQK